MANVIGQRIAGNLVYVDAGAHRRRVVDAIGPDVIKFDNDFIVPADLEDQATVTAVDESDAYAYGDVAGGALVLTTQNSENDGFSSIQFLGEAFNLSSPSIAALYFGARFKIDDATESDFFLGLCDTDTDILGGADDSIGFRKADGSTAVSFVVEKGTSETVVPAFDADTGWHIVEFFYDAEAGTLEAFVDGVSIGTVATTNLPDEEQRVSIAFLTGAAASKVMTIDWIRAIQIGGRATS